jgi:hypothetical protein
MPAIGPSGSQASTEAIPADVHALAQVEKWMAVIREVSAKPRDDRGVADNVPIAGEDR